MTRQTFFKVHTFRDKHLRASVVRRQIKPNLEKIIIHILICATV